MDAVSQCLRAVGQCEEMERLCRRSETECRAALATGHSDGFAARRQPQWASVNGGYDTTAAFYPVPVTQQ